MSNTERHSAPPGRIEVITGGMFSGKSEELVRRLRRALIARQRVQVFQPVADARGSQQLIVTRDRRQLEAIPVSSSTELREKLAVGVEVVGVDEAQFFDDGLVQVAMDMADMGVRMIIAGLDQDYSRRPFGPLPALLAVAEYVDKMHAVCVRCGSPAHYSQRIAGGSEQRQVGDVESYEARCRRCFQNFVPRVSPVLEIASALPAESQSTGGDKKSSHRNAPESHPADAGSSRKAEPFLEPQIEPSPLALDKVKS